MQITIETFGEAAFSRNLLRFAERAVDATPAFEVIAHMFWDSEKEQFESEGAWASGGWTALAPGTVDAKVANGWDSRILHRTLALRDSLTGPNEGAIKEIRPNEMYLGSSVDYGKYHQQAPYRSEWLPMRKPVELPEDVKVGMVKALQRYIVTGVVAP